MTARFVWVVNSVSVTFSHSNMLSWTQKHADNFQVLHTKAKTESEKVFFEYVENFCKLTPVEESSLVDQKFAAVTTNQY